MIYHITTPVNWQIAQENGFYEAASLHMEGFIHCSREEQVTDVLKRYYSHTHDLLLLHIDETKLVAPLEYELSPSVNDRFPHIYGRLNLDAVQTISPLAG